MGHQIFKVGQAAQVRPRLRRTRAERAAHLTRREAEIDTIHRQLFALSRHPGVQVLHKPPRLRRQLVERAAEDVGRQAVGDLEVTELYFDVLDGAPVAVGSPRDAIDREYAIGAREEAEVSR